MVQHIINFPIIPISWTPFCKVFRTKLQNNTFQRNAAGSSKQYFAFADFTEMLRALGYPHLVSMKSFRSPNFPLVGDLLVWLAHRVDPEADISSEKQTENERVTLVRSVAQFMVRNVVEIFY